VFISTTGIRETSGLTCVSAFQEDVKRAFVNAADKVILLATDQKFGKDAVRVFATFDQIDTIITNKPIESKVLLQSLNKNNVEVIVA
jgi:DeoR/GlpR family transcriptional regulator of sugar metabolism